MYLLGISAYYHDAAAAIIFNGKLVAAAQEERFTRIKHDDRFPINAIRYCLQEAGIGLQQVDAIAFYEKPFLKFERLLDTYLAFAPKGLTSFVKAMQVWTKQKLFIKKYIRDELSLLDKTTASKIKILFPDHHFSHAASAFFCSGFEDSAILVVDAVGEFTTTSIFSGKSNSLTLHRKLSFPHSVGLLYSAFTYWLGFKVNSGEYKLMGLAPYGNKGSKEVEMFKEKILQNICRVYDDGSVWLNQNWFTYATGFKMAKDKKWEALFGFKRRLPNESFSPQHTNLALAIQEITEDIMLKLCKTAKVLTGSKHLCLAGGVALNCVANSKIRDQKIFDNLFIQPAAGDAGGAPGAALAAWHIYFGGEKIQEAANSQMAHTYLGPRFSQREIISAIENQGLVYEEFPEDVLVGIVAEALSRGYIAGWFQGRMEFGPRALGNRSILADPRNVEMQRQVNLKTKFREGFRPFAPAVKEEASAQWFEMDAPSPFMLFVYRVRNRLPLPAGFESLSIAEKLAIKKSDIPAVTHADYSARVQTVSEKENEKFWKLLDAFEQLTGCPILMNTSFNVRGEPIVCNPADAISCFMQSGMDLLVLENCLIWKNAQPEGAFTKQAIRNFADD